MIRLHIKKGEKYNNLMYLAVTLVVSVFMIVYFLPRNGEFNYQYEINKPWKYNQLIASYNFPIYKDDEVVKHEKDSMMASLQPYYHFDTEINKEVLSRFRIDSHSKLAGVVPSSDYLRYIEHTLHKIYEAGIVSTEDLSSLVGEKATGIMIIENKLAESHSLSSFYDVKSAYEFLLNADSTHFRRDILRQCNLNEYITPNLKYDSLRTHTAKDEMLANYSYAKGEIISGQKIIDRGEIVSPEKFSILESLRKESIQRNESTTQRMLILLGQTLFVSILMLLFMVYLMMYRKDYFNRKGSLSILFALIVLYSMVTALMVAHNIFNINVLPYAMVPIIIRVFYDSRTAFITHVITILICSIALRLPHEFILTQLAAGMIAIYSLRELSQRSQLFKTAVYVILIYAAVYFAYELITENDLSKLNVKMYTYYIVNGVLLLFAYPLLFLFEKTFGFTSNVTLVELSNINNPLLRKMSEIAPGTFQHSLQVANLAAEVANRIGAKSQLVRTGALYHDIGKTENPAFFTENQMGGVNPHQNLSLEQSAQIVIRHVTDGLKLTERHNIPKTIRDFVCTHHGCGKTKYFYITWKNQHPGEIPNDALFSYPGPNPYSKETAILMMADSVEAASRSLTEYTEESISNLVDKIIDSQVDDGFFKECPLTFKDIAVAKTVLKEKLKTIYHTRISYPELKTEG